MRYKQFRFQLLMVAALAFGAAVSCKKAEYDVGDRVVTKCTPHHEGIITVRLRAGSKYRYWIGHQHDGVFANEGPYYESEFDRIK